jgi:protein-tyrosine-phosphatase
MASLDTCCVMRNVPQMKWYFVCSNNLVRSVIAEALCRKLTTQIQADSVGLADSCKDRLTSEALPRKRRPIAPVTRKFLQEKGCIGIENKRARQITEDDVKEADIIWVMTERHKRTVLHRFPQAAGKVRLLGDSEIKDSWKSKLSENHLQQWYDRIESALKKRLSESSLSLP